MGGGELVIGADRCPACGQDRHGSTPCRPVELVDAGRPAAGPCSCLPGAREGWVACASCGLPQAPGKDFCSFCGRRWVTEPGG